jgi:hypothetical protein
MENKGRTNGRVGSQSTGNGANGSDALSGDMSHAVATRLRDLGARVAPAEIGDVWVFPPLPHLEGSAEFLLFTRILPDEMRHLCGAEFLAGNGTGGGHVLPNGSGNGHTNAAGNGSTDRVRRITEYGAVPSHRISRLVAGFRERLGDHREPVHFEIGGCPDSWGRLVNPEVPAAD